MRNKINVKAIFQIIAVVLIFLATSTAWSQMHSTKIKDGSVPGSSALPALSVILELESTNKGFVPPRLTISQRDAIPMEQRLDGMLIYNKTTSCFNYWSGPQKVWLSLCGTPPPAVLKLTRLQCRGIKVQGDYKQGEFLTDSNTITVPITVTQAGTYELTASTPNGYYFYTSGTFPTTGTYMVNLKGMGTPHNGYNAGELGDELQLLINGETASCKPRVFVEKAHVDFLISCGNTRATGNYFIGQALGENNKLQVQINVTSTGYWNLETNVVNGYSFSGTGVFESTGVQTVELTGNGKPIKSGINHFNLTSNAQTPASCSEIVVEIAEVKYAIDCSTVVIIGSFMEDVPTSPKNAVVVGINVIATGNTVISTNTVSGVVFTSGPLSLDKLGMQEVTLTASGTPETSGDLNFSFSGQPGLNNSCGFKLVVNAQPISYTMNCSSITLHGSYSPDVAMTSANSLTVKVNVVYPGDYKLSTNTINGISFMASGTFSTVGSQVVSLKATGTPLAGGTFNYTITSNTFSGSSTCTKSFDFLYRTTRVLGLGTGTYQPGSASNSQSVRAILQSKVNFGKNGTVQVQEIVITNGQNSQSNELRNLINRNNIDIIFIGYNYIPNSKSIEVLERFVKVKKGVLIHAQENHSRAATDLFNSITSAAMTDLSSSGATSHNSIVASSDPIVLGPFGNLIGKEIGGDLNNSLYVENTPENTQPLVSMLGNPRKSLAVKHRSLGYVFIGDAGWAAGDSSSKSRTIFPSAISSTGLPISKAYSDGNVYNSVLYANIIAWAIKYSQQHTVINYELP